MSNNIFGYTWEEIQAMQQGKRTQRAVKRSASVQCLRCEKYFKLKLNLNSADPFPAHCSHCGYAHTGHDAKGHNWPIS